MAEFQTIRNMYRNERDESFWESYEMTYQDYLTKIPCGPIPLSGCEDLWTWNQRDRSDEVRLYGPTNRVAHFHPTWSSGTAGVRGTRILNNGRYYWELKVSPRVFGTSMMFGIGTSKARLYEDSFLNLLGEDKNSWGLSHKGLLWHGGVQRTLMKPFEENKATVIGLLFDGINGTLSYFKDGQDYGVAFKGLNEISEPLYPMIGSTAAKTEITLCCTRRDFVNLQDRCRAEIMKNLPTQTREEIDKLCLPISIKEYLKENILNPELYLPIKQKKIFPYFGIF